MSIGIVPSLAIGAAAFGAGELLLNSNQKNNDTNQNLKEVLIEARNINSQIMKIGPEIEDIEIVNYVKEIHSNIEKIIETVEKKPEKYKGMNNFFNYYLPTTKNLLIKYDEIENQRLKTAESTKFMKENKEMIIKVNQFVKNQLANLYYTDIVDTSAEMKVFDSMIKSEGFGNDEFKINGGGKKIE